MSLDLKEKSYLIEGGNHLSVPVTYDGVKNLINDAVKNIDESNEKMMASAKDDFEKFCKIIVNLSESKCVAKAFVTENVKEKFYENIRSSQKAHERIDSHLLSHKSMSSLIKYLITLFATSGWIFALAKHTISLINN